MCRVWTSSASNCVLGIGCKSNICPLKCMILFSFVLSLFFSLFLSSFLCSFFLSSNFSLFICLCRVFFLSSLKDLKIPKSICWSDFQKCDDWTKNEFSELITHLAIACCLLPTTTNPSLPLQPLSVPLHQCECTSSNTLLSFHQG